MLLFSSTHIPHTPHYSHYYRLYAKWIIQASFSFESACIEEIEIFKLWALTIFYITIILYRFYSFNYISTK